MKLKKEDLSVDYRGIKMLTEGNAKYGAETEGKAIQRLPYLEIHPMYSHQTQTLLQMPRRAC